MPDHGPPEPGPPEPGQVTPAAADQLWSAIPVLRETPPGLAEPEEAPAEAPPLRALDVLIGIALIWPMELLLLVGLGAATALATRAGIKNPPGWMMHPVLMLLHGFASAAWTVTVVWLLACRLKRQPLADGLALRPSVKSSPLWAAGAGVVMALIGAAVSARWGRDDTTIARMGSTPEGLAALAVMATAIAPIGEEVYYRGFIFPALRRSIGAGWAGLIVVVWFTAIHVIQLAGSGTFDFASLACVAGAGLVFTVIRQRSDSLLSSIAAHFAYNATLVSAAAVSMASG
jgi:membrane protease YdiL (CAAX protease family)